MGVKNPKPIGKRGVIICRGVISTNLFLLSFSGVGRERNRVTTVTHFSS